MLRRKLLLSLAVSALALAAAEAAQRAWLAARGEPYSSAAAREEIAGLLDFARDFEARPQGEAEDELAGPGANAGRDVLHPYHAFDRPDGGQQVAADLDEAAREPDELRVLIAGGSVAANFGRLGTARLEARIRAEPRFAGRRIRFLGYGRAAAKQPQPLMLVADLLALGLAPDAVVELDGFNEVAIGLDNFDHGMHPTFPARDKWLALASASAGPGANELARELRERREELLARATAAERSPLLGSSILGRGILSGLRRLRGSIAADQGVLAGGLGRGECPPFLLGPPFAGDTRAALELIADHWRESSWSEHLLCAGRGIAYLHVLQPTLHDEGSKPLTEGERAGARAAESWVRGVRLGYPMLRARGAELCARGVRFLDASRVFADVEERLYRDACHFGARGNELLADAIAAPLLELLAAK